MRAAMYPKQGFSVSYVKERASLNRKFGPKASTYLVDKRAAPTHGLHDADEVHTFAEVESIHTSIDFGLPKLCALVNNTVFGNSASVSPSV